MHAKIMIQGGIVRMRTRLCALILVCCLVTALDAGQIHATEDAGPGEGEKTLARLQERYMSVDSLRADFTQTLVNSASGEGEERSGRFYFKQPYLVRWETAKPDNELLVVGKDIVWDYFADEGVAYKHRVEHVLTSKTMIRFISGQARLVEEFIVTESKRTEEGLRLVDMIPKVPEAALVRARLWIIPDTWLLRKIALFDFYGNENRLTFRDIELNVKLGSELFEFQLPEDVEVFDNTKP